jgi:hypothetical protein
MKKPSFGTAPAGRADDTVQRSLGVHDPDRDGAHRRSTSALKSKVSVEQKVDGQEREDETTPS